MTIQDAISQVNQFKRGALTQTIASIESCLTQAGIARVHAANRSFGIAHELLIAAAAVKQANAQIDVVIHAVGILYALPFILQEDEVVECLSLGAGSASSEFDLVTNRSVAEFKFQVWRAKGNSQRQKELFEDFYKLARAETEREKVLYLLNIRTPLRFLQGKSQARRLLDKNKGLAQDFEARYGDTYRTVGEYYAAHKGDIRIVNLVDAVPGFDDFLRLFERTG